MKKRYCEYCAGYGYRYEGYGIGTLKCKQCNGEGRVDWPDEWRPYEQHNGKCARCGRYTSVSMGCPDKCKDYNGSHLCR